MTAVHTLRSIAAFVIAGLCSCGVAVLIAQSATTFAPLEQWKVAILSGDAKALKSLYRSTPAADIATPRGASDPDAESKFWSELKASELRIDVIQENSPKPGIQVIVFQAEVQAMAPTQQTLYLTEAQAWQQDGDQWRLIMVKRTDPAHLKQPLDTKKNIYPPDADAHAEIEEAEARAAKDHKRLLLVFGANWCYDCHVLDLAFQRPEFLPVIGRYEVVHIDIGTDGKKNADLARQFDIPLNKGVPALAVAESNGKLVVSQKNGEFENARAMTPDALLEFLNKWKAEAH